MKNARVKCSYAGMVLILCSIIAACEKKPAQPVTSASTAAPERDATFAQHSLKDWFIDSNVSDVPGSVEEITAILRQPDSVVPLPPANAQDPVTFDTVFEIHYPALIATVLKVGGNQSLQSVWVSDSTHLMGPIRIGSDT